MIAYFVSYAFQEGTQFGSGNVNMLRNTPISDIEQVRAIEQAIRDSHFDSSTKIVLTNWRRFDSHEAVEG